jgi:hypothetical protein
MSKKNILLLCILGNVLVPGFVNASEYVVLPPLIEHTTGARDLFVENIKISNNTERKLRIFPTVHEINLDDDGRLSEFIPPSMSDRTISVTSWIEVTRSRVEIEPRDTMNLPVTFRIDPNAKPGNYYAFLGFAEGSNADVSEARVLAGNAPGVIVRLALPETNVEQLRLVQFSAGRFIFDSDNRFITVEVENVGDTAVVPSGEVIFYNPRGVEVAAVPVSTNVTLDPKNSQKFSIVIPPEVTMGRHKAFLNLSYGTNQKATIYDTTFFTTIPLLWIVVLFGLLISVTGSSAWLYHRTRHKQVFDDETDEVSLVVRRGTTRDLNKDSKIHDINLKN